MHLIQIWIGLTLLLGLTTASLGPFIHHDDAFQPDHILRVTAQDYAEACTNRYSVLVNGSSPGPELRLKEGQVNWIRVYNDMKDDNTTIVSQQVIIHGARLTDRDDSTGMVSPRLLPPSPMAPQRQASGRSPQVTFSTTKSNLRLVLQGPTSIILMLDSKPSRLRDHLLWIRATLHRSITMRSVLLCYPTSSTRLTSTSSTA